MSERPANIGTWEAFKLICRMEWQRFRGRHSAQGRTQVNPLTGKAPPAAVTSTFMVALGFIALFVFMLIMGLVIARACLVRALYFAPPPGVVLITRSEFGVAGMHEEAQTFVREINKTTKRAEPLNRAKVEEWEKELAIQERQTRQRIRDNILQSKVRLGEQRPRPLLDSERRRLDEWVEKGGAEPFVVANEFPVYLPKEANAPWPAAEQGKLGARALALLGIFAVVALTVFPWGSGLRRLGSAGWGLEWLMSLPAPAPAVYLARVVGTTVGDGALWGMVWPALIGMMVALGHSIPAAILLALATAGAWGILASAIREMVEFALRRSWPASRLRNLEALCAIVGYILPLALIAVFNFAAVAGKIIGFGVMAGPWLAASPWYAVLLPTASGGAWAGLGLAWAWAAATCAVGGVLVAWWTRGGLLAGGGFQSVPQDSLSGRPGSWQFPPLVRKEFLLLKRDRAYFSRTIIVPLMAVGFQLFARVNDQMVDSTLPWLAQYAALLSYLLGAYIVAIAGYELLAREGTSVWLLFTFPRSLTDQLKQKARAWIAISSGFALLSFLAIGFMVRFDWGNWARLPFALAAVAVCGYVAGSLGIIGVKDLSQLEKPKLRLGYYWIFNVLTAGLGAAIFAGDLWMEISQVCIVGFTAYALWEKAADREVSLLDPTAPLPRKLYLAEVLIALAIFLAIAGSMLGVAMVLSGADLFWSSFLYLAVGGLVTVFIARYFSDRSDLLAEAAERLGPKKPQAQALGYAIPAAGIAIAIGLVYQWLVRNFGPALEGVEVSTAMKLGLGLAVVVGAPIFEEYLFRGLLYPLLRERWSPLRSALVSAVFFAALHSGYAAIPVFCVGLILAHVREKTNRLEACIAVHALYNFAMLISA